MYEIGNKTLCDICSSKSIKKTRSRKEQKETATHSIEGDHHETTPPTTPPPPSGDGIKQKHFPSIKCHIFSESHFFFILKALKWT